MTQDMSNLSCWPGIKPTPPTVEARNLNHGKARSQTHFLSYYNLRKKRLQNTKEARKGLQNMNVTAFTGKDTAFCER